MSYFEFSYGDTTYGKRIDILIACDFETGNDDVEICSIEFKKSNVATATLQQQLNKNLRINACILTDVHLFTENTDHQLVYFDFAGKSAYMLKQLRKSVKSLYAWKEFTVNLSNTIALSYVDQSYKCDLVEVSDYASTSPAGSPKRKVDPVIVSLSPLVINQKERNQFVE
ncbi:hypothetical protein INT47_007218 [Mucor saturninus]|uniref:Uncharacterized protein n=1 Tax=Mucor saturninus TaxID=64648 RepID=A0A8H7V6R1_9FUNG|nr:hypothetical protein INT47_007218 [Mucor saturninus]